LQERYERQIEIFWVEGQKKLKKAKATIACAGGLGSVSATYLNNGNKRKLYQSNKGLTVEKHSTQKGISLLRSETVAG